MNEEATLIGIERPPADDSTEAVEHAGLLMEAIRVYYKTRGHIATLDALAYAAHIVLIENNAKGVYIPIPGEDEQQPLHMHLEVMLPQEMPDDQKIITPGSRH